MRKTTAWLALPAALCSLFCLAGCVSVFEGTSQEITVVTNPPGAHCAFKREGDGKDMGNIPATPGTLSVRKQVAITAVA